MKVRNIAIFITTILVILSVIGLAYVSAQVDIGQTTEDIDGVIIIDPTPPTFNNATANVNHSVFADIWIGEAQFDNAVDLIPFIDIFVNESGDTMTGDLKFLDNIKAIFGTDDDAFIVFNGTDFIYDAGVGKHVWLKGIAELLSFQAGVGVIANEGGSFNQDFRAESDIFTHMFFLDAGNDAVTFGSSTELGFVGIDGQADEIQFLIQGNGTQTANLFVIENSVGTDLFTIQSDGKVLVDEFIEHIGDTNTEIRFLTDEIRFTAGDIDMLRLDEAGQDIIIFNGGQTDVNFQIRSQNTNNMVFMDASADAIGFFTNVLSNNLFVVNLASNFTLNTTFQKDVIIEGTLFGGSPVKIAGINITDNLFELIENRNSSSRFTLQNLNESTNATAVIAAVNDVGGSMFIGIGSSNFMLGSNLYRNITGLFSKSRGDMIFGNFFNESFTWLYNPSDDNDPNNLEELMNLNGSGLDVSGDITSKNVFIPQYIFSHTNETIPVLAANEWTNITFGQNEAHIKQGIDHHHTSNINDTFEIHSSGIYDISYGLTLIDKSPGATDIDMAARVIYINSTELSGSVFQNDIIKQEIETTITHRFLARLSTGDQIKFQFIASDANVELSDHSVFGDDPESALIVITKLSNIT